MLIPKAFNVYVRLLFLFFIYKWVRNAMENGMHAITAKKMEMDVKMKRRSEEKSKKKNKQMIGQT